VIANLTRKGENMGVARSGLHTNFDRAVKRLALDRERSIHVWV